MNLGDTSIRRCCAIKAIASSIAAPVHIFRHRVQFFPLVASRQRHRGGGPSCSIFAVLLILITFQ